MRIDASTILGILVGSVLVVASILLGKSPTLFFNVPSLLLVVGGTIGVTLIRNPLTSVFGTAAVVGKAFSTRLTHPSKLIDELVHLSRKARKESLLSLQDEVIEDPFVAKGIALCVDGLEPNQIRSLLETEIALTGSRHKRGHEILEGIGLAAPAFGLIGTLIGLVQMLATLDDPGGLGPAMALALLTTLYGALLANLFALPLADKLKVRTREELLNMTLSMEGVIGIAQGDNPGAIDERLRAYLDPRSRTRAA